MKRIYDTLIDDHLKAHEQMVFLSGPRQVGKTTIAKQFLTSHKDSLYLNWDIDSDRQLLLEGGAKISEQLHLNQASEREKSLILDEFHKSPDWKNRLKGLYDLYHDQLHIIVTGSARLDVYKKGGDSMMGRYFPYRVHPFSVGECLRTNFHETLISNPKQLSADKFDALIKFGGFPDPFIKQSERFHTRWAQLRLQQLVREDLRDLTQIQELSQIELLAKLIQNQASGAVNYSKLAKHIRASVDTVSSWLKVLSSFYYSFEIQPWTKNVARSLLKQAKIYLWDWSVIQDDGARHENFIASHLLKAVNFWVDSGLGNFNLHYIRDKDKREVDFLVTKENKPWFLVEVKTSEKESLSKNLQHFHQQLKTEHAFQVVIDMPYVNKNLFEIKKAVIVPAKTFLSQLI